MAGNPSIVTQLYQRKMFRITAGDLAVAWALWHVVGTTRPAFECTNAFKQSIFWFLIAVDMVKAEDRVRVEALQRGAESELGAQGRLHQHEEPIWGFVRYLVRQLCGDVEVGARKSA